MGTLFGLIVATLFGYFGLSKEIPQRSFIIDEDANTFVMDNKPFRYVSGSFHYFRALPGVWQKRLTTMRAGGLNAIDTYVDWSLHNPEDGIYDWSGIADIEHFLSLVQEENLYVILRPGPYICAEKDNGGIPYWLFGKYPGIRLRTSDINYTHEVSTWYAKLMPRLQRFLYGNGGPIIMVQVENEYGGFHTCDRQYLNWLRDETLKYVDTKALLFTTEIPNKNIKCGKIDKVFATTDFGIDRVNKIDDIWKLLRTVQPKGPLVNSEFYTGWLTHWQETNQRRDAKEVASVLRTILGYNASVNLYMYFGGTNFGFTAGANDVGFGKYAADITSYDYDAVIDETGNITEKFLLVRDVIGEFLPVKQLNIIPNLVKEFGHVHLRPVMNLLSATGRHTLAKGLPISSTKPKTFEELHQFSGLILYETVMPEYEIDPTLLTVNELRDRAYVYINEKFVGILSRESRIYSLPLQKGVGGGTLQLLVENQGRINYFIANDTKGILGAVTLQKRNGMQQVLKNWTHTLYPLEESQIKKLIDYLSLNEIRTKFDLSPNRGPVVCFGEFNVDEIADTHLNTEGWGKGVAFVNGFNLGRYWPLVGPQITLYVPGEILHIGRNNLLLIEYQHINEAAFISLDRRAQLDGLNKKKNP